MDVLGYLISPLINEESVRRMPVYVFVLSEHLEVTRLDASQIGFTYRVATCWVKQRLSADQDVSLWMCPRGTASAFSTEPILGGELSSQTT